MQAGGFRFKIGSSGRQSGPAARDPEGEERVKTTHRSYSDESGDFNRLSRFIIENSGQVRSHSTWRLGRFVDWKYGLLFA